MSLKKAKSTVTYLIVQSSSKTRLWNIERVAVFIKMVTRYPFIYIIY